LLKCFFGLVEQPHVFDRDGRLVREGLQEFDLSVRDRPRPSARDRNRPDGKAIAQYRDAHDTAVAADHGLCAKYVIGIRVDIRNLHETSFEYRARRRAPPAWRCGIRASVHLEHLGGEAVVRHEVEELAVEPVDKAELAL